MTAPPSTIDQHRLFALNRSRPTTSVINEIERLESEWIEPHARWLVNEPCAPTKRAELFLLLDSLVDEAGSDGADRFVARECTLDGLRLIVADFAVDALTEAQSFLPVVARLPIQPRMPVLRVLIDEFGCGRLERSHSHLYMELLQEVGLPTDIESHLPGTSSEALAFVNLFFWLASRADSPAWFLGALAHLEASIVEGFRCFVNACERLGIVHDDYYREHVHIDAFHRREMRAAITLLDRHGSADYAAAWSGARLAASTFTAAFAGAVARARATG